MKVYIVVREHPDIKSCTNLACFSAHEAAREYTNECYESTISYDFFIDEFVIDSEVVK